MTVLENIRVGPPCVYTSADGFYRVYSLSDNRYATFVQHGKQIKWREYKDPDGEHGFGDNSPSTPTGREGTFQGVRLSHESALFILLSLEDPPELGD